jgi:hypothetical protein
VVAFKRAVELAQFDVKIPISTRNGFSLKNFAEMPAAKRNGFAKSGW